MRVRRAALTLAVGLFALVPSVAGQVPSLGPQQIHVTLGETPGTLVVHWAILAQPYSAGETPIVAWQNGSAVGLLVGTIKPGAPSVRTTGPYETYVYAATIGPFAPLTEITYRVGSRSGAQDGLMSSPRSVRTPPGLDQPLRFVAYGDIGVDGTAADGSKNPARDSPAHVIRDLTIAQKPDLFLIPGDLAYANGRDGWDTFMRFSEPLQSTVPTMPVIGNHEWSSEEGLGYHQFLNEYVLPGDEKNYVFRAGPATFIGVNTDGICNKVSRGGTGSPPRPCDPNAGESRNDALVAWVEQELQRASTDETPWTIVYHHHPAYSWGSHGSDFAVQAYLAPLYVRYGVDLVVTAHDHLYVRTHPVIDDLPLANTTDHAKGVAPIYAVVGGGGRSLYDLSDGDPPAWLAHAEKVHHLSRVDLSADRLDFVALRLDGSEMDRFSITDVASIPPDEPQPTPSPLPLLAILLALVRLRKTRST